MSRPTKTYGIGSLTMELPQVTPTTSVLRHRSLTRKLTRADNKHLTTLQLTSHDPPSLIGLPRELRDEIFWLAVQDDVNPARDAELISRPSSTIRALTQVSSDVRAEVADVYWSRTKFHHSTHNLIANGTHGDDRGRYKLRSWLNTWGRLVVPHIRLLKLTLSFHSGGLDIQLKKHTRPSIDVWTGNGFGAEESLEAFVAAVLLTDGHSTMTREALEKTCRVLYEVGRIISNTEGYFLENGCVDRAERMEQNRAEVVELLSSDR